MPATLEERVAYLEGKVEEHSYAWQDLKERITHMEQTFNERFISLEQRIDRRFEGIDKRFEAIDKRFEAIDRRFEAIDKTQLHAIIDDSYSSKTRNHTHERAEERRLRRRAICPPFFLFCNLTYRPIIIELCL
jgi:chaperonin cofactor prefoldin